MMILRACRRMYCTPTMKKQRILITGGTDGIGREAAEQFAKAGHQVTISGRSQIKANEVIEKCVEQFQNKVKFIECDLSDVKKTTEFAEIVALEKYDIYVMNAGVMHPKEHETKDGHDMTIMTNLIAPYIICQQVLKRRAEKQNVHFVFVTSILLKFFSVSRVGTLVFDPENVDSWQKAIEPTGTSGAVKYTISKIGQATLAAMVNNLNLEGVTATSVHPGTVITNIMNGLPARHLMYIKMCKPFITEKEQAGSNLVTAALSPLPSDMYYLAHKTAKLPKIVSSSETLTAFCINFEKFLKL